MAKKVVGQIKIQCPGGEAKPGPPIGPVLGAAGVNIPMFCKEFNARTAQHAGEGLVFPTIITVFSDRTFTFELRPPPAAILLRKAVGADRGSPERLLLGADVGAGEQPQILVPPGYWQRARPIGGEPTLVSCVVAPGFDFADFALADESE